LRPIHFLIAQAWVDAIDGNAAYLEVGALSRIDALRSRPPADPL
jgi:hypothetical protein